MPLSSGSRYARRHERRNQEATGMTATTARTGTPAGRTATARPLRRVKEIFFPVSPTYLFMVIPAIVIFTLFITVPALDGAFFSFTNYVGYGKWHFTGIANYRAAFTDPTIRASYGFTLLFAITTTIVVNVTAMLLALGLNAKIKWQRGFRAAFFLPMVVSGLVIAFVFNFLFSTSLPLIAKSIGFSPLTTSILVNSHLAWLGIVFVSAWQAIPSAIIIFLAGLIAIPTEVYEAAAIDGATTWRRFRYMTLPLLLPFLVINSVLAFKGFLNVYEVAVGLTNGGPGTATTGVAQTIFTGFTGGDYGYQMANAVIFFIITLVLSISQLGVIRRRGGTL
jgi:raffinose/stachyose/melibiose transport system permease protein